MTRLLRWGALAGGLLPAVVLRVACGSAWGELLVPSLVLHLAAVLVSTAIICATQWARDQAPSTALAAGDASCAISLAILAVFLKLTYDLSDPSRPLALERCRPKPVERVRVAFESFLQGNLAGLVRSPGSRLDVCLGLLVGLALLIRLPMLTWGLPLEPSTNVAERYWIHTDEHTLLNHLKQFPWVLWRNEEPQYPSGTAVLMRLGAPLPALTFSALDSHLGIVDWLVILELWGRLLTMVLAALLAWVTGKIVATFLGGGSPLAAAAACTLGVWHVQNSCFLNGDVFSSFLFGLSTMALLVFLHKPGAGTAAMLGATAGVAASSKYMAGLTLVPACLFCAVRFATLLARGRQRAALEALGWATIASTVQLFSFFLLAPSALFHFSETIDRLKFESVVMASRKGMPLSLYLAQVLEFVTIVIGPVALLLPIGAIRMVLQRTVACWILTIPIFFFLCCKGFTPHHLLFMTPVLCAAVGCSLGAGDPRWWRACVLCLFGIQAVIALFGVYQRAADIRCSREFGRRIARAFPPRARVASEMWQILQWVPPGDWVQADLTEQPDVVLLTDEQMRSWPELARYRDARTGGLDPAFSWRFDPAKLTRQRYEILEQLLAAPQPRGYRIVERLAEPSCPSLNWPLEAYPLEYFVLVRDRTVP